MSDIISEIVTPTTDVRIIKARTIDNSIYRAHEGINQSFIKLVNEHGYNMAAKLVSEPEDPTDDMIIGSVFHALLSNQQDNFLRVPKMDRRTKDGKAQYESFMSLAAESGKTMVQDHLWEKAESLVSGAKDVVNNAIDLTGLVDHREVSIIGVAEVIRDDKLLFSLPVKGQIDHYAAGENKAVLIDYKTAPSSTYEVVRRKSRDSNWMLQAYLYQELLFASGKARSPEIMYVVSGKDTGASRAYTFSHDTIEIGRASLIRGLIRIHNQRTFTDLTDDEYFGITIL